MESSSSRVRYLKVYVNVIDISFGFYFQQMAPAKQAKVIKEFQKQSAQMDMTVKLIINPLLCG